MNTQRTCLWSSIDFFPRCIKKERQELWKPDPKSVGNLGDCVDGISNTQSPCSRIPKWDEWWKATDPKRRKFGGPWFRCKDLLSYVCHWVIGVHNECANTIWVQSYSLRSLYSFSINISTFRLASLFSNTPSKFVDMIFICKDVHRRVTVLPDHLTGCAAMQLASSDGDHGFFRPQAFYQLSVSKCQVQLRRVGRYL